MFNRIVVPVNGSELAERSIPYAADLAKLAKAPLALVRVVDSMQTIPPVTALASMAPLYRVNFGEETKAAQDYLARLAGDLRNEGLEVETICEIGPAVEGILAVVKPGDAIVISSHGRSGLRRMFFGSVAEGILHRSKAPVLVVRAEATSHDAMMVAGASPRAESKAF